MGLLAALSNAVSGLAINQQNLSVLSQNITNANTPGYSEEIANQAAVYASDGQEEGATIASITRSVNEYFNQDVRSYTSSSSAASTVQSYYSQIENLLGQPGSSSTIDQQLTTFFADLQSLGSTPSGAAQTTAVQAGNSLASNMSQLATSLQNLRLQSDSQISSAVTSINGDLKQLSSINDSLVGASAAGQNTSGLLDQRDSALLDLSKYIGVTPSFQTDGAVTLTTTSGITLLTQNSSSQLSYQPVSSTGTFTSDSAIAPIQVQAINSSGIALGSPQTLVAGGLANSLTPAQVGGSLQGFLQMRDGVLPNMLSQLDQLASTLTNQVNAITNQGAVYPPPSSYTSTREVSGSQSSQWTGNVQIAVLNGTTGAPIASPYADEPNGMPPLNLNLATLNTGAGAGNDSIDGVINAINQYYGVPQNKLELGSLNNVQLAVASPTVPGTGNTLSLGFNISNISTSSTTSVPFTVTGISVAASSSPNTPIYTNNALDVQNSVAGGQTLNTAQNGGAINVDLSSDPTASSYIVTATISQGGTTSTVTYQLPGQNPNSMNDLIGVQTGGIVSGSGTIVQPTSNQPIAVATLVDANGNPLPTNADGSYGTQTGYLKITAVGSNAGIAINQSNSTENGQGTLADPGTGQGFSQYFGFNNFFNNNGLTNTGNTVANSAMNLSVVSSMLSDPGLLPTGKLAANSSSSKSTDPNYTYELASGDTSISSALGNLANQPLSFATAGGLSQTTTTFSNYAAAIIANTSSNSAQATSTATDQQTLLTGVTQQAQNVSGVNLDQQLANTVIYQNAYTASTRVITVVDSLFTALMGILQ